MTTLRDTTVAIEDLLVDPNNYRFQDSPYFTPAKEDRFHEDSVQQRALERLGKEGLTELKNSIITNGFLPFERIIARRYQAEDGNVRYVVVEGNRRAAALKAIRRDYTGGVDVPSALVGLLDEVPITVAEPDDDQHYQTLLLSLMGVRHVGGIKEWGGYQRAKLVTELRDSHGLETSEIAARLGMTAHEVNRRYRAFRALRQMETDEEFGDQARPDMYALFHEAVLGTAIKDWLGWSDEELRFTNTEATRSFYRLISAHEDDEGNLVPPKLGGREAVRDLREILASPEAKRILLDTEQSFADALATAKAESFSRTWLVQVAEAIAALNQVGALELESIEQGDLAEIERLRETADRLIRMSERLRAD